MLNLIRMVQNGRVIEKIKLGVSLIMVSSAASFFAFYEIPNTASAYQLNSTSLMQSFNGTASMINESTVNSTIDMISSNMTNSTSGMTGGSTNQSNSTDMSAIPPGNTTGTGRRH
jgi:hypothetical protein